MTDHLPAPGVTLHQSLLRAQHARLHLRAASAENAERVGQNQLKMLVTANTNDTRIQAPQVLERDAEATSSKRQAPLYSNWNFNGKL